MLANYKNGSSVCWESQIFYIDLILWQNIYMSDDIHKIFSEEALLKDLSVSLKKLALKLTKNEHDALDLLQQTFENAIVKMNQFRGGSVKAWMSRNMRNRFIDNIRKKKEHLPGDDLQELAVEGEQFSAIEESEAQTKLESCVKKLNETEREIITLRMSDFTVNEITEHTGKTRVNVSQISARAKIKLNDCMGVR